MNHDPMHSMLPWDADPQTLDPQVLLGVSERSSREAILAALRERLVLISHYLATDATAASTWRIAMHAAALRLLLPASARVEGTATREEAAPPRGPSQLDAIAGVVLGLHGGWTPAAMQHLRLMAHSAGIPETQLVEYFAARQVSNDPMTRARDDDQGGGGGQDVLASDPPEYVHPISQSSEPEFPIARYALIAAGGIATCVVLALGLRIMFSQPTAVTPGLAGPAQPAVKTLPAPIADNSKDEESSKPSQSTPAGPSLSFQDATAMLRRGGTTANEQQHAIWTAFEQGWPEASTIERTAAIDAIVEHVYGERRGGAARRQESLGVLDRLQQSSGQAADTWRAKAWRLALASTLYQERDLDREVREIARRVDSEYVTGSSAAEGIDLALLRASERIAGVSLANQKTGWALTDSDAWSDWAKVVGSLAQSDPRLRDLVRLRVCERALDARAEALRRARAEVALRAVLASVDWTAEGQARARLVRWLGIAWTPSDTPTLLTMLITPQRDAMLDPSFVLTSSASAEDVLDLRDRLTRVWDLTPVEQQQAFLASYERMLSEAGATSTTSPVQELQLAAYFAGMSRYAEEFVFGGADAAELGLASHEKTQKVTPVYTSEAGLESPQISWGIEYVAAGSDLSKRRQLLLAVTTPPSRMEASILVRDATRGPNMEIRQAAHRVLQSWLTTTEVRRALLDFVPFIPATPASTTLIRDATGGTLPAPRDARWRTSVRRALVQSLAGTDGMVAAQIDLASSDVGLHYQARLARVQRDADVTMLEVNEVLRELRRVVRDRSAVLGFVAGQPQGLEGSGRWPEFQEHAGHPVHLFLAEQASLLQEMASEHTGQYTCRRAEVEEVQVRWRAQFESAQHSFAQVRAGEEAMARLWLLRLRCESEGQ